VKFRKLNDTTKKVAFTLELSKRLLYDQVTKRIADKLSTDQNKIRLTGHNHFFDSAKNTPFKRQERMTLLDMLSTYYQPLSDTLFFEALDVPVSELENKRQIKLAWHNSKTELVENIALLLPRDARVSDVFTQVRAHPAVKLDQENGSGQLRLAEVWTSKFHKIYNEDDSVILFNEYAKLRAEEISRDEVPIPPNSKRIHVVHFVREMSGIQTHSHPFYLVIAKDDTVEQVRVKIAKKLGVPEETVLKWKAAIVTFGQTKYLSETDVVCKHDFSTNDYFGLEHPDTTPRAINHRHYGGPPIIITG